VGDVQILLLFLQLAAFLQHIVEAQGLGSQFAPLSSSLRGLLDVEELLAGGDPLMTALLQSFQVGRWGLPGGISNPCTSHRFPVHRGVTEG